MQIIRKSVEANVETVFEFDYYGVQFLVKNLTDGNIYACLGDTFLESQSSLIVGNTSEYLIVNEDVENSVNAVTVLAVEEGEIEVQILTYSDVLNNIAENLETIENGVYGKDVRQAIHDSIQVIYNNSNQLEKLLKALIANETSESPSDAEIVAARGDYNSLNERLEAIEAAIANLS